ncbi:MAG: hypothetical protein M1414_02025, partial [Candidatus Thermoplasmatota archaeon]|nr:hypothetical protein [Candidatus Thermoplasmatota archaeon]
LTWMLSFLMRPVFPVPFLEPSFLLPFYFTFSIMDFFISCAIKGAVDAGLEINVSEEIFPPKDRLEGKHLKNPVDVDEIKKSIIEKVK